jgi:hypothetical protein
MTTTLETDRPATLDRRPFATLGHADHGWLDARHHFSFASYYEPQRMGWGALRVWNDDIIAGRSGFPPHPHQDMEIITYVRQGAITHEDSMGNRGVTEAGDIQVMSAGRGVRHSEFNLGNEETRLFQIWILPRERGGDPYWATRRFPREARDGQLTVLASGYAEDEGALPIRADARLLGGTLAHGQSIAYRVEPGRHAYLVPARGALVVNGTPVEERDGLAVAGDTTLTIEARGEAEIVLVDSL